MNFRRFVDVTRVLFAFGVAACNDTHSTTLGGGSVDAAIPGLTLTWRIVESEPVGTALPTSAGRPRRIADLPGLSGVKICVYGQASIPCAISRTDGSFVLRGLPAERNLVLISEKTGYIKSLRAIETASTPMDNMASPMVTTKSGAPRPDLGIAYDDSKGAVSFFAVQVEADGGLAVPYGVKVSLTPTSADGPFFSTADNTFNKNATSTVGGVGFFFNVEPGDYELTFDDPNADCAPISYPLGAWGYPAPPTSVRFPVMSGYATDQVGVLCTQKSVLVLPDGGDTRDAARGWRDQ